jgi:hypothetical protein
VGHVVGFTGVESSVSITKVNVDALILNEKLHTSWYPEIYVK